MRRAILLAAIAILSGTVSRADVVLETASACSQLGTDMDVTVSALEADGWQPIARDAVSDEHLSGLAVTYLINHLPSGAPAERVKYQYELQLATARGLLRKADLDTAKLAIMTRGGDDPSVIAVNWLRYGNGINLTCRAALADAHVGELRDFINSSPQFRNVRADDMVYLPLNEAALQRGPVGSARVSSGATAVLLAPEALAAKLEIPFPFGGVVEAHAYLRVDQ